MLGDLICFPRYELSDSFSASFFIFYHAFCLSREREGGWADARGDEEVLGVARRGEGLPSDATGGRSTVGPGGRPGKREEQEQEQDRVFLRSFPRLLLLLDLQVKCKMQKCLHSVIKFAIVITLSKSSDGFI